MRILFTVPMIALMSPLLAVQSSQQVARLPKIIVKATELSLPPALKGADITRIDEQDLEQQQAVTLVEALRRVPGAYLTQDGGIGQKATLSLRGAASGQTAVILDGMHINDVSADNGAVDLAPWLVDDIANIDVIRGPFSSMYGSDAIGGVVVLNTKKGMGPTKAFGKAEGGAYGTYQEVLGVSGQKNLWNYQMMASRLHSNGSPVTPDRFRGLLIGKPDDPLHQENISARFGGGDDSSNITLFTRYLTRRLGYRGWMREPWRQDMLETFNRLQGHLESSDGKWVHDGGIGYYLSNRENENPSAQKDGINKGNQTQADWRQTIIINETLQAQTLAEIAHDQFFTHSLNSPANKARSNRGAVGGALAFKATKSFTFSTALRVDKVQRSSVAPTYRIGGEYDFYNIIFKGGIGTGFKAPTLAQRFYKSPFFTGNLDLKPEKSLGWDIGFERSFFTERVNLGLTLFQNRIRDMIARGNRTNINLNRVRTQGFEAILKIQMNPDWRLEVAHTFTQAWDTRTGLKIIRYPPNKTTAQVVGQVTPDWQVSGNALYVSQQFDTDFRSTPYRRVNMPGYVILGAETSYQLTHQWQVYGRGENLLNHRYENPSDYQQSGFGLYVGVRAKC
ncbi:MAG: TonB-dependent receptor [Alphaproteobacteria bacterium]|nr:TonB-dependent receptor [Alphaproteobacteria bacterium]